MGEWAGWQVGAGAVSRAGRPGRAGGRGPAAARRTSAAPALCPVPLLCRGGATHNSDEASHTPSASWICAGPKGMVTCYCFPRITDGSDFRCWRLQVATARHGALFQRFISALTRAGPGGMPRPIEMHAHDPRRYIGCVCVHSVHAPNIAHGLCTYTPSCTGARSPTLRFKHVMACRAQPGTTQNAMLCRSFSATTQRLQIG